MTTAANQPAPAKKPEPPRYAPGPNDPKLFNTIRIWDCYVVARTAEEAQATLNNWIRTEGLDPSETTALPVTREVEVRESWRDQKPLVGSDITDDEFNEVIQGHTTIEVFTHFYSKR